MVYSLRIGTKNFARLYVEVPVKDKISRNGGTSFVTGLNLWTLHNPYMILGLLPHGFKTCDLLVKDNCYSKDHGDMI